MKGQKIHDSIAATASAYKSTGRGRNAELIAARNKLLCYRYYYYAHSHRMKFDFLIAKLESEFALRAATIVKIITEESRGFAQSLFQEKPTIDTLAAKYPHWVWREATIY